ncbi:MAG TPA: hypothetical protein VNI77_11040, partial [Nitrososphaera sp.]|nr:hypothetical protein [Nitrososphaera sp.]
IVTMFTGSFFTEAPLSKENYQPERIRKNVEEYFGLSAETDNPQVESKLGTLMFRYKGPRFLLALVISEHAELGRAFLQFVYLKAEFSGTKKIMSPGEFKQGLALMPPVEVYPGFAKSPKWTRIEAVRGPGGRNLQTGNLSGQLAESNRITVSCQRDRVNSGPFTLSAVDRASPDSVLIRVLPSRRLVLEGGGSRFLRNAKWDNNRADATTNNLMLSFGLVCDQSWSVTCGSKVEQVKWDILPNYEESSSSLRDTSTKSASLRYVQSLSTINPADEPHRIYGLVDLIASLYSWNLPVRKQNFTFLEFCQRTGQ